MNFQRGGTANGDSISRLRDTVCAAIILKRSSSVVFFPKNPPALWRVPTLESGNLLVSLGVSRPLIPTESTPNCMRSASCTGLVDQVVSNPFIMTHPIIYYQSREVVGSGRETDFGCMHIWDSEYRRRVGATGPPLV